MLLIQRYHSIHEIDAEFIPDLENLLQEEMISFKTLVHFQDKAPEGATFTYFLFFTSGQNSPVGIAQLELGPVILDLPWYKKIQFWNKNKFKGKYISWKMGNGSAGLCVFQPKFLREGNDKVQSLINEYQKRKEIILEEMIQLKGLQDFKLQLSKDYQSSSELYVLEPLIKINSSYQEYLQDLGEETLHQIKKLWKELHTTHSIDLGDYHSLQEALSKVHPDSESYSHLQEVENNIEDFYSHALSFEKDGNVLGFIFYSSGKKGNVFFEPFPLEKKEKALVSDELYIQYALLKFFELEHARKCHLIKSGEKIIFESKNDLTFFTNQGLQFKTIHRFSQATIKNQLIC